ncbi:GntR family transcriptional regulator [Granulicella paludicola]|uniref:GntR family transcriptional regulator n=1 Tax=Granulicella paludicola TaxID=474951 RepID=UPI0021E0B7B8|nr:GntR family transcriptional regulator [Granulicella paludicola]
MATAKSKKPAAAKNGKAKAEHGTSLITAFREIRELIVHGRLSPGTWILEADLAERLNMSRTPVRGAIHWLQREGYVLEHRNVSKSRMIVAPLTKEDANELYRIIGSLEGIAGRGVTQLPEGQRKPITTQLRALNERLSHIASGQSGHPGEIFEIDRDFHRLIIKYGAGPRLTTLHGGIEPQTERYWRLYASSIIKDLHTSVQEHETIIRAVESGDSDAVDTALQANWLRGADRLGHVIDIFGERGSW